MKDCHAIRRWCVFIKSLLSKELCGRKNNVDRAEQDEPKQSIMITTVHIFTVICGWWRTLIPLLELTCKLSLINKVSDIILWGNIKYCHNQDSQFAIYRMGQIEQNSILFCREFYASYGAILSLRNVGGEFKISKVSRYYLLLCECFREFWPW